MRLHGTRRVMALRLRGLLPGATTRWAPESQKKSRLGGRGGWSLAQAALNPLDFGGFLDISKDSTQPDTQPFCPGPMTRSTMSPEFFIPDGPGPVQPFSCALRSFLG